MWTKVSHVSQLCNTTVCGPPGPAPFLLLHLRLQVAVFHSNGQSHLSVRFLESTSTTYGCLGSGNKDLPSRLRLRLPVPMSVRSACGTRMDGHASERIPRFIDSFALHSARCARHNRLLSSGRGGCRSFETHPRVLVQSIVAFGIHGHVVVAYLRRAMSTSIVAIIRSP